jgi:NAD(P)-dependent dehydrogenase (short-subunit alcohol dehydrogenase family)
MLRSDVETIFRGRCPRAFCLTDAMPRRLTLITGGTRGIGAATAVRLAAGHDLVLGYAQDDDAANTCRQAVEDLGARCLVVRSDVSSEQGVEELFAAARSFGRLTGVVNNAGATSHLGTLAETPPEVIRRTVDLNLIGALLVARAAVRALSTSYDGEGGVLVNVSSGAATLGSPGEYVQYAAAKAGVDAMTLGLAQEVADGGVRVVGVAPGMVNTRIHEDAGDRARLTRLAPKVPLGRAGEPEEIANAIAWLLSDEASYITGTTLRVAGGR